MTTTNNYYQSNPYHQSQAQTNAKQFQATTAFPEHDNYQEHPHNQRTNDYIQRIYTEQSAVQRIISKVITVNGLSQDPYISLQDIYQDIACLACNPDTIAKRYLNFDAYFYRYVRFMARDAILKEKRHIRKFKLVQTDGIQHHKNLTHPSFSGDSNLWLDLQTTLTAIEYRVLSLYHQADLNLAEITSIINSDCRRVLDRATKKALAYLTKNEEDNKQVAYMFVRSAILATRQRLIIKRHNVAYGELDSLYSDLATMERIATNQN